MKNDLSKKENRDDSQKKLKKIKEFKELFEKLKNLIEEWVLDKIEDESLKQCIKLLNLINKVTDQLNQKQEEDLNEKINKSLELSKEIIEYWGINNGYEKCFNPSRETKNDKAFGTSYFSPHSPDRGNIFNAIVNLFRPYPDKYKNKKIIIF